MKFKTKEEIIRSGTREFMPDSYDVNSVQRANEHDSAYKAGVTDAFESITESIKFYTTYLDAGALLKNDKPELFQEFIDKACITKDGKTTYHPVAYNYWLLKHCFGALIL